MKLKKALVLLMIPAAVFAQALVAGADPAPGRDCDYLNVIMDGKTDGWVVKVTRCKHGTSYGVDEEQSVILGPANLGILGAGSYGPDCTVVVERKGALSTDKDRSVFQVGQTICDLTHHHPKIHVRYKSGKELDFKTTKSSYHDDLAGYVTFKIP